MRALPSSHPPRAARRLAGAAFSAALVGITATTAFAASDAGDIQVSPGQARPGSTVTLSTEACGAGGSAGVDASALGGGIIGLEPKSTTAKTAQGDLRIPDDTKPGNYAVGGSCTDGQELVGTVVVGDGRKKDGQQGKGPGQDEGKGEDKGQAPEARHEPAEDRAVDRDARQHEAADGQTHDEQGHEAKAPHDPSGDARPEDGRHEGKGGDQAGARHFGKDDHHDDGGDRWQDGHERDGRHDGRHDDGRHDGRHDDRHGKMPHGRVHTGLGGGVEDRDGGLLAGGSVALTAAAGGVLYLRRRHRRLGA
jgi:hypothetical protein